jgi:DHA2 family multidrug resistance protein-like MFS transporter
VSGSVVFNLGIAAVVPLTTDIIVGSVPPERAGAASGISETGTELGGALGIAVLGSIGAAVYRSRMASVSLPDGIPPEAAETAHDTLGGAVAVADGLPGPLGAGLLGASREAFTQALQAAALTSAAIALGIAVLVLVLLGNVRTGAETAGRPDRQPDGPAHSPTPEES